ncbi:MAG TPA: hypothetical protein H9865_03115 [Candidatus Fournierella pullicola]|uniref:Uncharacterized protein n=1 Tax=Candidatus Allofournierella pullicola TaxID=2838596 RepID=A0A9D1V317_9FIRM|nr:hypothetical protein [Candidatus Fournierella pullicola]
MRQLWLMVCAAFLMLAACTVPGAAPPAEPTPGPSAAPLPSPAAPAQPDPLPTAPGSSEAQEAAGRPQPQPVQDPEGLTAALEGCVSFGEGEAGVSLKTAIAAAELLNWTEANAKDSSIDAMTLHLENWLAGLDAERQNLFWANWPAVDGQAWAILRDMPGQLPLLADAGDPQRFDHYTPACYERLTCAVEQYLEKD